MNILVGTFILAFLLAFCAHIIIDVWAECRFQTEAAEHDELLDKLWTDEPPSAVALEAVQPRKGTGSF